jgi:hypothetical protein
MVDRYFKSLSTRPTSPPPSRPPQP